MAIENLKNNIEHMKKLISEIYRYNNYFKTMERNSQESRLVGRSLNSLISQLKIINKTIPELLESISPYPSLKKTGKEEVKSLSEMSYKDEKERVSVTLNKRDRKRFLEELSVSRESIKRLKKPEEIKKEKIEEFRGIGAYAKLSNRIFFNMSSSLAKRESFKRLNSYLRKANMTYLLTTYISVSILSTLIALITGIVVTAVLFLILGISAWKYSFIIILLPFLSWISFYFYPWAESRNIAGRINQEIPFATIHMSAIAGSGIEPSQIFKIIALSEEYPYTKKEVKKIINQVNLYGYDIVTSLRNTARETSSKKLSELLNGIATTISGGGDLSEFLDKRAESLIFEYKLDRERYTKSAETFMDVYISIMIAAPMILTLLLVLISISGISIGLSISALTVVIVSVVSLINIIFLIFLHLRQPSE